MQQDINTTRKQLSQNFTKIKSKIYFLGQKNGPSDNDCADTFPNDHTALRIYLCLMVSNYTGERSCLKKINSELRNTSGQRRVSALSLMSIQHEIIDSFNIQELINDFAVRNARKGLFEILGYIKLHYYTYYILFRAGQRYTK